jgi:hypothetical protein
MWVVGNQLQKKEEAAWDSIKDRQPATDYPKEPLSVILEVNDV